MLSNNVQNMSVNTWKSIPKQERNKMVLQFQQENNKLAMQIDEQQKELVELRKEVPEKCRNMFEQEKMTLLKHYTTANLFPEVPKAGFGPEETRRMVKSIKERVDEQAADCRESRQILARAEEIEAQNALRRAEILARSEILLKKLKK